MGTASASLKGKMTMASVNYDNAATATKILDASSLQRVASHQHRQRLINMLLLSVVLLVVTGAVFHLATTARIFTLTQNPPVKFCYYSYVGENELVPEAINGSLCTHLVYGFADIVNHTIQPRDPDTSRAVWHRVVQIKKQFPDLSVLLSVGAPPQVFSNTTGSEETLMRLVASAAQVIQEFNFDGLDLDWEFPTWNGVLKDRANFIRLLQKLRAAFDGLDRHRVLLTAAVAGPFTVVEASYDIPDMAKYLDYCLIMGYDFNRYNPLFPFAEFNSPLFSHQGQVGFFKLLNLEYSSYFWLRGGMPRQKLVVGVPFYGVSFKLADPALHGVGAPIDGIGVDDGMVSYGQVCDFLANSTWTSEFHNESRVPFAYQDRNWISYDDVESIAEKASWIMSHGFAGVMTFDLNNDDFGGRCAASAGRRFPLQTTVDDVLRNWTDRQKAKFAYAVFGA